MHQNLSPVETRVLGSLIEKETTTPEYYPLTLNALMRACTQKSNRHPVMDIDEKTVFRTVETLIEKKFARRVISDDSRVPKYRHTAAEMLNLDPPEIAALCVLLLRGPQTVGEIRGRTGRLYEFESLDPVETALQTLIDRQPQPLVAKLPRRTGMKEARYTHLLSGEIPQEEEEILEPVAQEIRAENDRIAALEDEVQALRDELQELKDRFESFKTQFE